MRKVVMVGEVVIMGLLITFVIFSEWKKQPPSQAIRSVFESYDNSTIPTNDGVIELMDLIKMVCITENENHKFTAQSWKIGAEKGSPIMWETEGVVSGERKGKVIVSFDGKFQQQLRQNLEPAYWDLRLGGPRAGVSVISLSSPYLSEISLHLLRDSFIEAGADVREYASFGGASDGGTAYEFKFPDKQTAWLHIMWTGGSGGTQYDIGIFLTKDPFLDYYRMMSGWR